MYFTLWQNRYVILFFLGAISFSLFVVYLQFLSYRLLRTVHLGYNIQYFSSFTIDIIIIFRPAALLVSVFFNSLF